MQTENPRIAMMCEELSSLSKLHRPQLNAMEIQKETPFVAKVLTNESPNLLTITTPFLGVRGDDPGPPEGRAVDH